MMMMMMMNSLQIQIDMDSLSEMLRSHLKRKEAFMSKIIIISNNHNYGIIMFEFCIDGILDGILYLYGWNFVFLDVILYLYGWNFVFVWMEFCIYGWNFVWMGFCICMDVIVLAAGWYLLALTMGGKGGEIKTNYFAKNP